MTDAEMDRDVLRTLLILLHDVKVQGWGSEWTPLRIARWHHRLYHGWRTAERRAWGRLATLLERRAGL